MEAELKSGQQYVYPYLLAFFLKMTKLVGLPQKCSFLTISTCIFKSINVDLRPIKH